MEYWRTWQGLKLNVFTCVGWRVATTCGHTHDVTWCSRSLGRVSYEGILCTL